MAWSAVEHDDEQVVVGVGFAEPFEETLQAPTLSIPGRYRQKLSPVAGSTAAYR
jgi:hypothetical protein